jgi:hypothetical protein
MAVRVVWIYVEGGRLFFLRVVVDSLFLPKSRHFLSEKPEGYVTYDRVYFTCLKAPLNRNDFYKKNLLSR